MFEKAIRSFIAVTLKSQVIGKISAFQKMISDSGADVRLVKTENIHITLRFLGELLPTLVTQIGEELKTIQYNPFEVSLKGVGVFQNMKRINVVWIGIEKGVSELVDIHHKIESKLMRLGINPDHRGFTPHITIARVRSARNRDKLAETILNMWNETFGAFSVDSVKLQRSVLTPKGPIYTTLTEVPATIN